MAQGRCGDAAEGYERGPSIAPMVEFFVAPLAPGHPPDLESPPPNRQKPPEQLLCEQQASPTCPQHFRHSQAVLGVAGDW